MAEFADVVRNRRMTRAFDDRPIDPAVIDHLVDLAARDVAAKLADAPDETAVARHEYWAPKTRPLGTGGDMHVAFSFAAQAALCEIDLRTGEVAVKRIIAAHDVGRAINPLTLEGQIEGGIVMCIGYALTEHYIQEDGKPWTSVMARYKTPSITHAPPITSHIVEHELSTGPFGAKGMGEAVLVPTASAVAGALYAYDGVRRTDLPMRDSPAALAAVPKLKRLLAGGKVSGEA